jgi:3-phenylpropionate/trans-cinnamate dioxygenase ferredoxin reductase subunit
MTQRFVLVGGGVASAVAATELRSRGFDGEILLVADEPHPPYERPPLSKDVLLGQTAPGEFDAQPSEWYREHDVELRLDTRATAIEVADQVVTLSTGERVRYEALVLATGARPRRLPSLVAGERVHYLRTLADAERLRGQLVHAQHIVIVGAGFVGCEVAAAAIGLGIGVTMVDPEPTPLQRVLGARIGTVITDLHRTRGVDIRAGDVLSEIVPARDGLVVTSEAGHRVECDLVVVGVGCIPNTELAAAAGLTVDNGIVVDEYGRAAPHVYAAGDVANQYHPRYGRHIRVEHHDTAQRQARYLAGNLTGAQTSFAEPPWFWSDQYDITLQSLGRPHDFDDLIVRGRLDDADFSAFSMTDGRIDGVITVNRPRDIIDARRLLTSEQRVTAEQLRDESTRLKRLLPRESKVVSNP